MLILEGSDCLGKTTFAELLLKEADSRKVYPTYYSHMSRPNCTFNFCSDYKDMMSTYAIQDRFHLGGIVWHNAISKQELNAIELWLKNKSSMVVVLYASDHDWYRDRIEKDNRGNMLPIYAMCAANKEYELMAKSEHDMNPLIDLSWDITPNKLATPNYPDELYTKNIIDMWFKKFNY